MFLEKNRTFPKLILIFFTKNLKKIMNHHSLLPISANTPNALVPRKKEPPVTVVADLLLISHPLLTMKVPLPESREGVGLNLNETLYLHSN